MKVLPYIISRLGPREAAREIENADDDTLKEILNSLDSVRIRRILRLLSSESLLRVVRILGYKRMADLFAHMKDVEAVSILRRLPRDVQRRVIDLLPERERIVYPFLLKFSKDVAGGWIRVDFLRTHPDESAVSVRRRIREHRGYLGHIIVENEEGIFLGVVPLDRIIRAPRNARVKDLMEGAETVDTETDSGELVRMIVANNPDVVVVLDEGKAIGIITREEAIHLLEKEHAEDLAKIFSMRGIEHVWTPIRKAIKNRSLWLVINLFTAFLAASVVNIFEETIKNFALLAVFMPIVPGEAGNATTQTMAIVVRGLATGEMDRVALYRVILKEVGLGLINGAIVGIIAFIFTYLWKGNVLASLALAIAMPLSMLVAALAGVGVPLILRKMGQDPASSSTIILTTITDVTGFLTFLGIATLLMKMMGL